MARPLPPPERDEVAAADLADYDIVRARQASLWAEAPRNSDVYFGALLNSPTMAATIAKLGRFMREGQVRGTYSDADREWVDMVISIDFDYRAILALHIPDALACGVRLEAIEALWERRERDLSDDETFLAGYIRGVIHGRLNDEQFDAMVARSGNRTATEYTAFICFLMMTFRLWMALGVPDPTTREIDDILRSYREGTGPQVAAAARIG
jgi:hypothetical protein